MSRAKTQVSRRDSSPKGTGASASPPRSATGPGSRTAATARRINPCLALVGDRIYFAEERRPYRVQARDARYIICTRPHQGSVLYTIIDLRERERGPDNAVLCWGYETRALCEERLRDLNDPDHFGDGCGPLELSRRHSIPLFVTLVEAP